MADPQDHTAQSNTLIFYIIANNQNLSVTWAFVNRGKWGLICYVDKYYNMLIVDLTNLYLVCSFQNVFGCVRARVCLCVFVWAWSCSQYIYISRIYLNHLDFFSMYAPRSAFRAIHQTHIGVYRMFSIMINDMKLKLRWRIAIGLCICHGVLIYYYCSPPRNEFMIYSKQQEYNMSSSKLSKAMEKQANLFY